MEQDYYKEVYMEKIRIVNLGISLRRASAKKDIEILKSIRGQLSDGIWENVSWKEPYWKNMEFEIKDNKVVFITHVEKKDNPFNEYSDAGIINYFADTLKTIYDREFKDRVPDPKDNSPRSWALYQIKKDKVGEWEKNNKNILRYLGYKEKITVGDAFSLYKRLKKLVEKY